MTTTSTTKTLATGFLIAAAAALTACSQTEDPATVKMKDAEVAKKIGDEHAFNQKLTACMQTAFKSTAPQYKDTTIPSSASSFAEDDLAREGKTKIKELTYEDVKSEGSTLVGSVYADKVIKDGHNWDKAYVASAVEITADTWHKENYALPGYTSMADPEKNEYTLNSSVTITLPREAFNMARGVSFFKGETVTHIAPTLPQDQAKALTETAGKAATQIILCMGKNF